MIFGLYKARIIVDLASGYLEISGSEELVKTVYNEMKSRLKSGAKNGKQKVGFGGREEKK